MALNTLVLGGYGNFGTRICRALAGGPHIALHISGRDARQAAALAQQLGHGARGLAVDVSAPGLADTLRAHAIGLVIHTAGPFQGQDYAVAHAAAAAGAHYLDLADGRRFVCDFPAALDATFRAAGRQAVTGASTVPALSAAVVDALTAGWRRIDRIDTCIAPAQGAPRGQATLAAVLGYCGAPVAVWQDGRWTDAIGWARPEPVAFARLAPRRGALCDIPDLELLPQRYPGVQTVRFTAALQVPVAQRAFAALAWLRQRGLLRRPERLARLLHRAGGLLDGLGSALGGMVVRVAGQNAQGAAVQRAWHLAADRDHGPEIPCMPAILLARRWARGEGLLPGASTSAGALSLADFAPEFARWAMVVDVVDEMPAAKVAL